MDSSQGGSTFVLTTEVPRGIAMRACLLMMVASLGPLAIIITPLDRGRPLEQREAFQLGGISLFFLGMGVVASHEGRGTWILNDEGITFHPCHRRGRTLSWTDVEKVQWGPAFAVLQGRATIIQFAWRVFPEPLTSQARAFIESRLSSRFDLKPVPYPESPLFRSGVAWIDRLVYGFKLFTISLGVLIGLLIPPTLFLVGILFLRVESRRWVGPAFGAFTILYLIIYLGGWINYAGTLIQCDLQPVRKIHPAWPWRRPHEKARVLTASKTGPESWLEDP